MVHLISNASKPHNPGLSQIWRGEELALKLAAKTGNRAVSNLRNAFEALGNRCHESASLRRRQWLGCVREDGLLVVT
jgi:hypothetical protein